MTRNIGKEDAAETTIKEGELQRTQVDRRQLLLSGAALAGAAAFGISDPAHATATDDTLAWDYETDVVCVGSGAAACSAAIAAVNNGAGVMILEKMPILGGTTAKSSGVTWIPNHVFLRSRGIEDKRYECLEYLARYAYPQQYIPNSPTLGLDEPQYRMLEAFYDNGWRMIDHLQDNDVVQFREFKMWFVDHYAPDYADHLPENKVPRGRALEPTAGSGTGQGGGSLIAQMSKWLQSRDVPMLTEHHVTRLLKDGRRVIGIEAQHNGKPLRIKARRGVIFGTGGYAHNPELVNLHQPTLYGSCSMLGSTGDFITIGAQTGARMGALHTAWRTQLVLDEALENPAIGRAAFVLPGDSMILVNKYGRRITNEKRNYNDRTRTHFYYDPTREEYPNQLQFMVFDARTLDAFGGALPLPREPRESRFLIKGGSFQELARNIDRRLGELAQSIGGIRLAENFSTELDATVQRFNTHARRGEDPEFARGKQQYDLDWHKLFSPLREDTQYSANSMPNLTMHPFTEKGPYYAFILAAGALDTNGGPMINEKAQVLDHDNQPIPGLYGAGNCIASPTHQAYCGAGCTIGLALTFGYIAGNQVAV